MKIYKKTDLTEQEIETLNSFFPVKFKDAWYDTLPRNIQKYLEEITISSNGLFLYGNCGTGKTHVLTAIVKNLLIYSYKGDIEKYEKSNNPIDDTPPKLVKNFKNI